MAKQGTINVTSENIFPVIKKFMYSDHEIFLRELVSNAVDAILHVHKLDSPMRLFQPLEPALIFNAYILAEYDQPVLVLWVGVGQERMNGNRQIRHIAIVGSKKHGDDLLFHYDTSL